MAGLGYVTVDNKVTYERYGIPIDESCCGMLFDYGYRTSPFDGHPLAQDMISNGQVVELKSSADADNYGIDNSLLSGVPRYHINQFFEYTGDGARLYVMFANCYTNFDAIQVFQRSINGKLFQIGVWTERSLWAYGDNGEYEFTNIVADLQHQAEELGGRIGMLDESVMPLSVILCANTAKLGNDTRQYGSVNYRNLPNAINLNCSKVSIILGQNGTDEVHKMQADNNNNCPVGFLGVAMACLYLATAEKSIGDVSRFNLNKNDTINDVELGFGNVSSNISISEYSPITEISKTRLDIISKLGYIVPVTYRGKEAEVFFSNDQTLSNGDYRLISLNRIMNKCRRIIRGVLLPYLNSSVYLTSNNTISDTYITIMTNSIAEKLDAMMVSKDTGNKQIVDRMITIDENQDVLKNDGIALEISLVPANISAVIEATETSGETDVEDE